MWRKQGDEEDAEKEENKEPAEKKRKTLLSFGHDEDEAVQIKKRYSAPHWSPPGLPMKKKISKPIA